MITDVKNMHTAQRKDFSYYGFMIWFYTLDKHIWHQTIIFINLAQHRFNAQEPLFKSKSYFFLRSTVQHHRRPDDAVVSFVEVVVIGWIEVCENKHRLKLSVVSISKLLDVVCHYARGADVLKNTIHNMEQMLEAHNNQLTDGGKERLVNGAVGNLLGKLIL